MRASLMMIPFQPTAQRCASSSAASSRWKSRQGRDPYAREAKVQGLKSRAAFKLLEMDAKYRLFKKGMIVVDLGFAPGSWSQVAQDRTKPHNHVLGIDILPAQPPRGVSSIQGNFLSPAVQALVKESVREAYLRREAALKREAEEKKKEAEFAQAEGEANIASEEERREALAEERSYLDMERLEMRNIKDEGEAENDRVIVLSDMSAPWLFPTDFRRSGMNNAYLRMMNTSGISFRDHAGSMDLCSAALRFASDTLKNGGHFVCKFYQGSEDKEFEKRLKKLFDKVYREKPDSSRKESREAYFVALRRKKNVVDEQTTPQDNK
ncbi:21S rRNA (uridine(2791)-2'-O)-methyltransferase [Scedosporium apiospermum]|uniref:rRNA methyltransferase 2, mitochondrial n=1 Tax=Pseudallescheria apiosperma TaxID=563466 RepID=A0A084FZW4_PSEDA|nr:21S rRNA (uridine(2791)-2'-O)-methyltransferase [Scedosporium apiospermum]KEZ40626.1 21S rRNA (uridine(2791)-2'-O)-methyltransferase [Scedosporium apiospermum]